ncbi:helix-turn-helix domain-containing protein [Sphingomonas sp. RT2P30]|uniref:TetR/AcrR family transcriptional regulator n=1 Tax=Parasphingomonas halimpatiens TaxID=3096162 RepID=UPI002FC90DED
MRTRRALLDALLRLIETRPFEQVTIREIASEARIGYATFFRHYPSKEALLHDLAAAEIAGLLGRTLPILFSDDSRRACVALFEHVAQHRPLWSALLTGGAAASLKQEFTDQAKRVAEDQGAGGRSIPDELRAVVAVAATVEIIAWWLHQDVTCEVERVAEILDRLVVAPAIAVD